MATSPRFTHQASRTADFSRHSRKCTICSHPEREAIEELFLHWHTPRHIAYHFQIPDSFAVYRHARAAGLYALRRRNIRFALEFVLEQASSAKPTSHDIIRAVRAYACLNDSGEWIEPAVRVVGTRVAPAAATSFRPRIRRHQRSDQRLRDHRLRSTAASPAPEASREKALEPTPPMRPPQKLPQSLQPHDLTLKKKSTPAPPIPSISNRNVTGLETPVNASKQTTEVLSNRTK